MKKSLTIFIFLLISFLLKAQVEFRTIVPGKPVNSGESFQVQYVIRNAERIENFKAPSFAHFRFVSGPNPYNGSVSTTGGIKSIRNFVYTLEAIKTGRFIIPGAIASVNGKTLKSDDVELEIISKGKAAGSVEKNSPQVNSDYVLMPGENPYEKIRKNLFLKVLVDRTSCYAGEPVQAVFKLYSRLESNSDIVKNPGFYGFTVYDMVNLSDKQMNTEMVNGKLFDVHTIRKVQLYPLQAGAFTVDAMEVKNKVEFSRSAVSKKTEQEIIEGIPGNSNEDATNENTEVYETEMMTKPVIINVFPVPEKYKPAGFNGAVGTFSISAKAVKEKVSKNEEDYFEITISGSGNFTQLNAPAIEWPVGIEGFEPEVSDSLDKSKLPLTGSRTFRYAFVCNKPGLYYLPSVKFSFFVPPGNNYKIISTTATQVEISNEEKKNLKKEERKETIAGKNARASRVAAGIVILLVIIVLAYWIIHKDKTAPPVKQEINHLPSFDEGLGQLGHLVNIPDKEFCTLLHRFIWKNLELRHGLEGSAANKKILYSIMKQDGIEEVNILKLQKILMDCEMGMFTGATLEINKDKMLKEAKESLEAMNPSLVARAGTDGHDSTGSGLLL